MPQLNYQRSRGDFDIEAVERFGCAKEDSLKKSGKKVKHCVEGQDGGIGVRIKEGHRIKMLMKRAMIQYLM